MNFSSVEFLLYFLPLFFLFYGLVPGDYKNAVLLLGSFLFYAQGSPQYLVVLLVSLCANFWIGLCLEPSGKKKRKNKRKKTGNSIQINRRDVLFWLAVTANVGLLVGFKLAGSDMPLGLSFYTFQVVSYLADVYRGEVKKEQSFSGFMLYLTMFPKMGSGPITAYEDVRRELKERRVTAQSFQDGLKEFALGLGAKVLLADRLGILWNDLQVTGYESISGALAWIGAVCFSLKLYFDFYGYSLMAVGLGRMVGFELPENFHTPYMARSVREFYRRWHITLGRWFWKYVYVPLGGSRKGELRTIRNLLVVWLLTGFWHGVSVNYLLWGLFLGTCIILERLLGKRLPLGRIKVLPHLYLWIVIPISWMCFAITDLTQLQIYLGRMLGIVEGINVNPMDWYLALKKYGVFLVSGLVACTGVVERIYRKWKDCFWMNLAIAALFWFCVWRILLEGNNPFMYLNF